MPLSSSSASGGFKNKKSVEENPKRVWVVSKSQVPKFICKCKHRRNNSPQDGVQEDVQDGTQENDCHIQTGLSIPRHLLAIRCCFINAKDETLLSEQVSAGKQTKTYLRLNETNIFFKRRAPVLREKDFEYERLTKLTRKYNPSTYICRQADLFNFDLELLA